MERQVNRNMQNAKESFATIRIYNTGNHEISKITEYPQKKNTHSKKYIDSPFTTPLKLYQRIKIVHSVRNQLPCIREFPALCLYLVKHVIIILRSYTC